MRTIRRDTQFKRDVKRLKKRNKDFEKLKEVIVLLVAGEKLPAKCKDHRLKGILKDCRECYIEPERHLIIEHARREVLCRRLSFIIYSSSLWSFPPIGPRPSMTGIFC